MSRRLGAVACVTVLGLLAGCGGGGGETTIGEQQLHDCLARAGIVERPLGSGQPEAAGFGPIFNPDFTAYTRGGIAVGVVIERSADRARSTAADVRSAFASLGGGGGAARVVSGANAVAVFSRVPPAADRAAVRGCIGS